MKKALCCIIAVCMLICTVPVFTLAASPDMGFSMEGAGAGAGETVQVKVNLTKNPGIWAARFTVNFDSSVLTLTDVTNGSVFSNGEFVKSLLDLDGYYIYYAQLDSFGQSNHNVGTILTLTFKVSEDARDGNYGVYLDFPEHGKGWFFSGENPNIDYTVPADGEVRTDVTVSTVSYRYGDINRDGKINPVDCNLLKRINVGEMTADSYQRIVGDLNHDNKINPVDVNLLKRLVVN